VTAYLNPLQCNGSPHTFTVSFLASNIPFQVGGDAAIHATANASGTTPNLQSISQFGQVTEPVNIKR
jgi:hypothetical protein